MISGKVALITGASQGIGAATARELSKQGASVVLLSRNKENCENIANEIQDSGNKALAIRCDVSIFKEVKSAIQKVVEVFGGLDVLINNAGVIEPIASIPESDPKSWTDAVSINLFGAYYMVKAALPFFGDAGVIINIGSGAANKPQEGWSAYCASKAGLSMLTRSIALEIPSKKIRVYGYAPGTVDTQMQDKIRASGVNPISQIKKEDHWKPETTCKLIAWLCTEEAIDLSGEELSINDQFLWQRAKIQSKF